VLKRIIYRAENALNPGIHSSSQCPSDGENLSSVNQLAVKLDQERESIINRIEAQKLLATA
jgi:hypothetical protein